MTYTNFKTMVLSYVNRSSTLFTEGSLDYVLIAMNDARRAAQRDYTFNLNRTTAFAQLSIHPVSLLTDFDTLPTGGVLRAVKQVDAVYEYSNATVGGSTRYFRTAKMPFRRQSHFEQSLPYSSTALGGLTTVVQASTTLSNGDQFIYQQGVNVAHSTLTDLTWYMFDVIEWLADHDGGASEDIFLTYFVDWLKYATLLNLNQYLKDTERFAIDSVFVDNLFSSVKQFDSQQGAATGAIDLE